MSRPPAPSYVVEEFAPDPDYPAGGNSWNSNATKVAPPGASSVGFTPGQGNAAQYHNWAHNKWSTNHADAKAELAGHLEWHGQIPALTFLPVVNANAVNHVKFNKVVRKWFGLGSISTDYFTSTADFNTWPGATEVPVPQKSTQTHWDFDIDTAGNMMIVDNLIDGTKSRTAAGTWVKNTGQLGHDPEEPNILYEPVSGKWCCAFKDGVNLRVATSTNLGVTWTLSTSPTFVASSYITLGHNGAGRIVMQGALGTNVYFSYSDDGGVTWSASTSLPLGFTVSFATIFKPKPIWTGTHWVAIALNTATPRCKVFNSTDGATWTEVASFATTGIKGIDCIGSLILGTTTTKEMVVSVDGGVTWRWSDHMFAETPWRMCASDVRFVACMGDGKVYRSVGAGLGNAILT